MIKAVLFDFDGTLVDNMRFHFESISRTAKGKVKIKPMDLFIMEGRRGLDIIRDLLKDLNLDEHEIRKFVERKKKLYMEIAKDLRMRPDALRLIKKLRKLNYRIGLVTGSVREYMDLHFSTKEYMLFDHLITDKETKKYKPDPEPYIKSARGLGVKPEECVVIENAPLGVESAKSAGMICIGLLSTVTEDDMKRADFVVKNLDDAEDIIKKL